MDLKINIQNTGSIKKTMNECPWSSITYLIDSQFNKNQNTKNGMINMFLNPLRIGLILDTRLFEGEDLQRI